MCAANTKGSQQCSAPSTDLEGLFTVDHSGMQGHSSDSLIQRNGVKKTLAGKLWEEASPVGTLIAYWNFEDSVGDIELEDVSGNGHSLTCTKYDIFRDYAQVAPGEGLQATGALGFPDRSGAKGTVPLFRTLSLWMKRDVGCCLRISKLFGSWYPGGHAYVEILVHFEKLDVVVNSPTGQNVVTEHRWPIATESAWTHLAISIGTDQVTSYLDNQEQVSKPGNTWLASIVAGGDLAIQLGTAGPQNQFHGYMDDVRLYTEALTQEGVETLFNGAGAYAGFNSPPFVYGGDAKRLVMPVESIDLAGTCEDSDGPKKPGVTWTIVSQPVGSAAKIEDPTDVNTTVTFEEEEAEEGEYVFSLSCTDGEDTRESEVVISVNFDAPKSLSAYWRFEELEGTRKITDDSGMGHTLTLRRWSWQHPFAELELGQGLAGGTAVRFFYGSSGRATVLPFRTLSFWLWRDPGCCERIGNVVQAYRKSGSDYFHVDVNMETMRAVVTTAEGAQVAAFMPFPVATETDEWVHIVVVIRRDQVLIYKDGQSGGSSAAEAGQLGVLGKEELTLTLGQVGPHNPLLGSLDEVRLYQGALDEATVAGLAAARDAGGLAEGEVAPIRADAGPAQSIWMPAAGGVTTAKLEGTCSGGAGAPTVSWAVARAPGALDVAAIQSPAKPNTTLTLAAKSPPGDYVLTFTCTEGDQSRSSELLLAVFEPHQTQVGQTLQSEGQPADLPGVAGSDATPIGLWLFDGDLSDAGSGGQPAKIVQAKGITKVYDFVEDGKFGGGLNLRCEMVSPYNCVQLDLGNLESADSPWSAMSVSFWFKSSKTLKLTFLTKGSFKMDTPRMTSEDAGKWHHYIVAADEKIRKVYFDGKLTQMESGVEKRSPEDAADAMTFGIRGGNPGYGFDGVLDELAVFDFVLSNDEVEILHLQGAANLKQRPPGNPYARGDYAQSVIAAYFQEEPLEPLKVAAEAAKAGFFGGDKGPMEVPAAYVHPRIFFTPEELPLLRERQRSSTAARLSMENLRSLVEDTFPFEQLEERNFTFEELKGEYSEYVPQLMIMMAFRSLIDGDRAMAVRLGQQMDSLAEEAIPYMEAGLADKTWARATTKYDETDTWQQLTHNAVLRVQLAFMYDFLYPYLVPSTRDKVRRALSVATNNTWAIGMDALHAYNALASNWIPWVTGDLVLNLLAIEGEDGFDKGVFERATKALLGWTSIGISKSSGATFEGGGKNAIGGTKLLALAKHGHPECMMSQGTRKFAEYLLHTMLPNGEFFQEDLKGGIQKKPQMGDVSGLKFAFPDNMLIDYVYRRTLLGRPSGFTKQRREYYELAVSRSKTYVYNNDVPTFIYAMDFAGPADIEEHEKLATEGVPLTYVAREVGMMISRSSWGDEDAAWFVLDVRSVEGGHAARARGTFLFYALGEIWGFYPSGDNQDTNDHSVISVDGRGQSNSPGRFLRFADSKEATWGSCDLQYPYSWGPWKNETVNHFLLEKGSYKWMDLQHKELPHWYRGVERSGLDLDNTGALSDFRRAFRTAGLVRGGSVPYSLILDDFQKDDLPHTYVWRMALQPTEDTWSSSLYTGKMAQIDRTQITPNGKDLILEGAHSSARLLVRLLDGSSDAFLSLEDIEGPNPLLTMTASTKEARFRVLLWPLREGAALPTTTWNAGTNVLTIANPDGVKDELTLEVTPDGLTTVASLKVGGTAVTYTHNIVHQQAV